VDAFARLPAEERATYFRETANRMGLGASLIVEKDFWVCWTLRHVFLLDGQPRLVFKGGTSLSKCYRAIQRFSEDIDLAFHREDLGAVGDADPALAPSRKARDRLIERLRRQVRAREEKARQPSVTEQRQVAKRHVLRRQLREAASESLEQGVIYLAVHSLLSSTVSDASMDSFVE
jgi:predicted nucleotidyltransferase component of viral defense system